MCEIYELVKSTWDDLRHILWICICRPIVGTICRGTLKELDKTSRFFGHMTIDKHRVKTQREEMVPPYLVILWYDMIWWCPFPFVGHFNGSNFLLNILASQPFISANFQLNWWPLRYRTRFYRWTKKMCQTWIVHVYNFSHSFECLNDDQFVWKWA